MNFPLFNFVCSDPSLIYRMLAVSATVPKAAADVAGIHIYMFVWFVGSFVVVVVGPQLLLRVYALQFYIYTTLLSGETTFLCKLVLPRFAKVISLLST